MSVGTETQIAVYNALTTPLTAIGCGLYDEVPELPVGMPADSFPYVEISDVDLVPYDTDDNTGYEVYVTLNIWSRYRGKKEAHNIFEVCRDALHKQTLNLSSWTVFDVLQFGGFTVRRDSDNATMHGVGRFVAKMNEDIAFFLMNEDGSFLLLEGGGFIMLK